MLGQAAYRVLDSGLLSTVLPVELGAVFPRQPGPEVLQRPADPPLTPPLP